MKNEALKKLTDQVKKDLTAKIAGKEFADFLLSTKAAADDTSGTFKVVVSTENVDRQGETVKLDGWDLSFFKMNPVVLWAHDYESLPVGVCTSIGVVDGKLVAEGRFAPKEANPFAQQVRALYDAGIVRTTSVGFIPLEFDEITPNQINRAELLEFSFVPVPANPYALTMNQVKKLGLDAAMLTMKGLDVKEKEPQPGSACELDDGTPGVLSPDPKNPDGPMICAPANTGKKSLDVFNAALDTFNKHMQDEYGMHGTECSKAVDAFKAAMKTFKDGMTYKDGVKDAEKGIEVSKDAVGLLEAALGALDNGFRLETQRHSKGGMDGSECFVKAIKPLIKDADDGDAAGGNDTAAAVDGKAVKAIEDAIETLNSVVKSASKAQAGAEGGKKETADRSKSSPTDDALKAFLQDKQLVKVLNIALGKVLRHYNLQDKAAK